MAMIAGKISRMVGIPSTGRDYNAERDSGAIGKANLVLQNLSIGCRVSVAGRVGRRRPGMGAPLVVVMARRASSSSGDKQREEKRSVENIPSSPPPPSTNTNSVGVREEEDAIEMSAVSEAPVDELPNLDEKREEANNGSPGGIESLDEIGKAISDLKRERASTGLQDSAGSTGFWKGVAEETSLIDWPVFSKVLGTTGVVVAMILGSSVVLLTVNAILAATSDFVFNDPAIRDIFKPT